MAETPSAIPLEKIPQHVAMIMDGNGRWAIQRGRPRLAGHKAGTENLRRVIRSTVEFGVKYLTIYAFSTENWGRPPEEVKGLMLILQDVIDHELNELHKEGVQLRHYPLFDCNWYARRPAWRHLLFYIDGDIPDRRGLGVCAIIPHGKTGTSNSYHHGRRGFHSPHAHVLSGIRHARVCRRNSDCAGISSDCL